MTLLEQLTLVRPRTPSQLHAWLRLMLDLDVPRRAMEPDNDAPFDYLCHAFFEETREARDSCVWANRGGGKTMLAAAATLLDLLFKPGIKVCLLGGSFEQAARMHEHLVKFFERPAFEAHVKRATRDRLELHNGSVASVLSQSQTSVRGWHVHRLRCDEVELFEQELWEAAQLTTRSGWCGDVYVRAGIEAFSTMHRAGGLMSTLVERAARRGGQAAAADAAHAGELMVIDEELPAVLETAVGDAMGVLPNDEGPPPIEHDLIQSCSIAAAGSDSAVPIERSTITKTARSEPRSESRIDSRPIKIVPPPRDAHGWESVGFAKNPTAINRSTDDAPSAPLPPFAPLAASLRLFRWGVLEVLERCGPERSCASCVLFEECGGRAKSAEQRGFVSIDDVTIQKQRVSRPTWDAEMLCRRPTTRDAVYGEFEAAAHVVGGVHEPRAPIIQPSSSSEIPANPIILAGIDFGYRAPTVVLLARYDPLSDQLLIFDELHLREHTTERIITMTETLLIRHGVPRPNWIGADPAGHQRSEHTGQSTVALWKRAGFAMRTRRLGIEAGLDAVRARLRAADGSIRLRIHARCGLLIRALREYRYPADGSEISTLSEAPPLKDGPDHAADALRYLVINLDRHGTGLRLRWS